MKQTLNIIYDDHKKAIRYKNQIRFVQEHNATNCFMAKEII